MMLTTIDEVKQALQSNNTISYWHIDSKIVMVNGKINILPCKLENLKGVLK